MIIISKNVFDDSVFYHGTSDLFGIGDYILPPSQTGKLQEKGRKKNLDKIFVTKDVGSAKIYAGRAVQQFGGNPIIYKVEPENITVMHEMLGTSVYLADKAKVLGIV